MASVPPVQASSEEQLVAAVRRHGGRAGNVTLQRELGWDEDRYWTTRDRLVDAGRLELGRGRGGSVALVEEDIVAAGIAGAIPRRVVEGELYGPVAAVLARDWARDMRFREHLVEVTARQGRRDTGGTWTRPDIVVAALRVFTHVPGKVFDVITFELKPWDAIDVTAVFEALSHRRAATHAYVWLHVPAEHANNDDTIRILERVADEAKRHGVGLIVASDPADYGSWDFQLRAVRHDPDPESLNEFIAQQLSSEARDELAQWFR